MSTINVPILTVTVVNVPVSTHETWAWIAIITAGVVGFMLARGWL